ncbi:hypothetical protein O9X98_15370 [Agrobacterium salinitolerans]|nr:hypothetical protein [Agrobacterium salinitolerans]
MKKLSNDFLTIGRGAEYVVRGDESIILVSAGRHLEITTRLLDKASSSLVLRDPTSPDVETVIFSGTAAESMQAFLELGSALTKKKRPSALAIIKSLSVSVASIAVIAALTVGYLETRRASSELQAEVLPALSQQETDLSSIVPGIAPDQAKPSNLKVLKKPEFLNASSTTVPEPATEVPSAEQTGSASAASTIGDIGLPAYNPALYAGGEQKVETPNSDVGTAKDVSKTVPAPDPKVEPKNELLAKPVNTDTKVEPTKTEDKAAPADQTTAKPKEEDQKAKAAEHAAIQKNAEAAINTLIGNGMTDADVRKLLMNLQQINAGGDQEITPEMLRALPEEIAALLADQGMDLDGPGGGTMNILPSEVVDQFRGKDGVATIPENYSWYARTGGPVSIPLPGGGDIKHPDDFKDFGLQP